MSERRPCLIVVSAPSGAGKSTILARVLAELPGLRFSVSHTTRAPRAGERDGVQYHFVSRPAFEAMVREDRLLEWATVHGELYGTSRDEYERAGADGVDLLLDIDVQGAAQIRSRLAGAVGIFILPPSFADLERRLRGRRQDGEASIRKRLENARREVARFADYEYLVVNQDLESCVDAVKCVVRAARQRTSQLEGVARRVLATFQSEETTEKS